MRRLAFAFLVVISLLVFNEARAAAAEPPEKDAAPVWYGWQTLAVDGAALATMLASPGGDGTICEIGLATYAFGPPVVHLAHASPAKAAISFGVRTLAPVAGVVVGFVVGFIPGALLGGLMGYGGAVGVDAAVLGRERPL